jgi:hypothetical protein
METEISNGLFVTDYEELVNTSWDILLRKENEIKSQEV